MCSLAHKQRVPGVVSCSRYTHRRACKAVCEESTQSIDQIWATGTHYSGKRWSIHHAHNNGPIGTMIGSTEQPNVITICHYRTDYGLAGRGAVFDVRSIHRAGAVMMLRKLYLIGTCLKPALSFDF